jgi:hypothetical protein
VAIKKLVTLLSTRNTHTHIIHFLLLLFCSQKRVLKLLIMHKWGFYMVKRFL